MGRRSGAWLPLWLTAVSACGSQPASLGCEQASGREQVYPFTGTWTQEASLICLHQHDAVTVTGTWEGQEAVGLVHEDGTLYLMKDSHEQTMAAFSLLADTLTVKRGIAVTSGLRWIRTRE